jgi:hypothetical protein
VSAIDPQQELLIMAKRRKLNPKRFQKKNDQGLFSFDPIRRNLMKWGAFAGIAGGFLILFDGVVWQIVGVFTVVIVVNYHISKASRGIPRLHATVNSFIGVVVGLFGVILLGTLILTFYRSAGG